MFGHPKLQIRLPELLVSAGRLLMFVWPYFWFWLYELF